VCALSSAVCVLGHFCFGVCLVCACEVLTDKCKERKRERERERERDATSLKYVPRYLHEASSKLWEGAMSVEEANIYKEDGL